MQQGCRYCAHNEFDYVHMGSNICSKYTTHINPYSEGYCDGFKSREPKPTTSDTIKLLIEVDEDTLIKARAGLLGSLGDIIAQGTVVPSSNKETDS